jgi:phospholipid N-methyltransferase
MNLRLPPRHKPAQPAKEPPLCPDWWLFFTKFLRHGRAIASFTPSSPWLAHALVRDINFSRACCVVELGAGTGPVTAALLRRNPGPCRTLIVERDPDFCRLLRHKFPRAEIAQADAADLEQLLAAREIHTIDHCLCGLPLPSFAPTERDRILKVIRDRLAPEGTFRQLTVMPGVYYLLYRRYFTEVNFQMVWWNLPPAGFYVCRV